VILRAGANGVFSSPTTLFPFATGPSTPPAPQIKPLPEMAAETTMPMEIGVVEAKPAKKKSKGKKKSTDPPNKPNWTAYADRITALLATKTKEEMAAMQGNGISDFLMFSKDKLGKITDVDELKFVQEADLRRATNMAKFHAICQRVQYHGLFLKHICAANKLYLGRFINETAKVVTDAKGDVVVENGEPKLAFVDNSDADLKQRADGKVMFVGIMAGNGPNNPKPKLLDFRLMNKDRIVPGVVSAANAVSTTAVIPDAKQETAPVATPSTPSPKRKNTRRSAPLAVVDEKGETDENAPSPKRQKTADMPPPVATPPPRRGKSPRKTGVVVADKTPAKTPAPTPAPATTVTIPPPTVATKNPVLISNGGGIGARTMSGIPLHQEIAKAATIAAKNATIASMNGHAQKRPIAMSSGQGRPMQEENPDD
jgi:hypothetical protein